MSMHDPISIPSPAGVLRRRMEHDGDLDFRFHLFCHSRPPEFALLRLEPGAMEQLMRSQFQAQTISYRAEFPKARFDIIEIDDRPIGRIVVDRSAARMLIVDQAVVPELRNRGIGTAIMRGVMEEARAAGLPVRLQVATSNDPSLRLYLRLGFVPLDAAPIYMELEWRPDTTGSRASC